MLCQYVPLTYPQFYNKTSCEWSRLSEEQTVPFLCTWLLCCEISRRDLSKKKCVGCKAWEQKCSLLCKNTKIQFTWFLPAYLTWDSASGELTHTWCTPGRGNPKILLELVWNTSLQKPNDGLPFRKGWCRWRFPEWCQPSGRAHSVLPFPPQDRTPLKRRLPPCQQPSAVCWTHRSLLYPERASHKTPRWHARAALTGFHGFNQDYQKWCKCHHQNKCLFLFAPLLLSSWQH